MRWTDLRSLHLISAVAAWNYISRFAGVWIALWVLRHPDLTQLKLCSCRLIGTGISFIFSLSAALFTCFSGIFDALDQAGLTLDLLWNGSSSLFVRSWCQPDGGTHQTWFLCFFSMASFFGAMESNGPVVVIPRRARNRSKDWKYYRRLTWLLLFDLQFFLL